MRRPLLYC